MSNQYLASAPLLNRISLQDVTVDHVDWDRVGCAVFACGTEARSTAFLDVLPVNISGKALVLEFEGNDANLPQKGQFAKAINQDHFLTPGGDTKYVIEAIIKRMQLAGAGADTIFIDISSMPRRWYLGIITWVRFSPLRYRIVLGYAGATYPSPYPERQIIGIHPVPGTGGFYDASQPIWAIVSLGFDSGAVVSVEDRIEPDRTICLIARSDNNAAERARVEETNAELISRCRELLYVPHMSFSLPLRTISELIAPIDCANIVCVPLGPKTHVVAFALAGLINKRAANVHVISRYNQKFEAEYNGTYCLGLLDFVMAADDPQTEQIPAFA